MTPAIAYTGVIVSVQGMNPGPASGITYTVDVNMGETPKRLAGIRPNNKRLPDVIHTRAASTGEVIQVFQVGEYLQFFIDESFDYDESCNG